MIVDYEALAAQWPGDRDEWFAHHPGLAGVSLVTRGELAFLVHHIPETGRFLEIGTACGVTAALVARARPAVTVVCVDNFSMPWPDTDTLVDWRANKQPNMRLWYGTTAELLDCLEPDGRFDVAFVDADHTFAPTLGALRDAAAMLRPGGIIMAHDWCNPGWPEVAPAIEQFREENGWKISDCHRLMVALRRKGRA